ncbi:MAG: DUF1345 domain-containing protein [Pseudomonadota bacterium]
MNPLALPRALAARPILLASLGVGVALAVLLTLAPNPIPESARLLTAWDCGAATFVTALAWILRDDGADEFSRRARRMDEGRHFILALCIFAAAVSVLAILEEFKVAKDATGAAKAGHIIFALFTVALSWTFVHAVFASHYAHEYFGDEDGKRRAGLKFPGEARDPNWLDFVHFAFVIGVAAQTADVQIESREIRRTVTWHGIVALLFNTVILALAVNLAASVF